ncbi:GtrA family protein [Vibrio sp. SCSIO 43136]|uniref:GtrA family protein n=1 Tax=Vibrio sp. SCSIO 43136 TaxID=2819101 RepID=UPI002075319B|nr:GtrA family protein [Vibrio sp. SCSIO 43136]USD64247.1 GtrA family protein [Vibrio sp. SCSIO 43136]
MLNQPLIQNLLQHRLVKFAFVGGVGFLVDLAVFSFFLEWVELETFVARVIAFICAATATWFGNRTLTFSDREKESKRTQWRKSLMAACMSALPNLLVFKLIIIGFGEQGLMPYIALVAGILVGMFSNYFLSSKWVFADKKSD